MKAEIFAGTGVLSVLLLMTSAAFPELKTSSAKSRLKAEKLWVYVGTYTAGSSKGIYRYELDLSSGKLTARGLAGASINPSYLAIHPGQHFLYAVNEISDFEGKKSGAISAFSIEPRTGNLTLLNQQPSGGEGPCYIVVDRPGKHVLVANYSGGSVSVLPIQADGRLGEATAFVQHEGHGATDRQAGPHAHSINLDPANHFACAADLGLDKILIYRYDSAKGTLAPNDPAAWNDAPGSGPRHFAFHPDGHHAYVVNEINSTVTALAYDAEHGTLKTLQTLSTLPQGFTGNNSCADVHVHPSGKFLYTSNRGHNSIAIFSIDPGSGELSHVGHQVKQIKTPRNFALDATGTYLLVANQDGNTLVVFPIDPATGELGSSLSLAEIATPVCVKLMAPPG